MAWFFTGKKPGSLPVVVRFTRLAPSSGLDDDNLSGSMKAVRDAVARWLGVDDRDPRVKWQYDQRREKEWGVEVQFQWADG